MVNARLEAQRQTIRHYWLNGIKSAKEIQKKTSILLHTIERNLKKLRETAISWAIGQYVHKNTAVSTCQLATKIEDTYDISISYMSIWRNMKKK
ncbi:18825_t:CDS:2, partial [Funneliformis geosporum]